MRTISMKGHRNRDNFHYAKMDEDDMMILWKLSLLIARLHIIYTHTHTHTHIVFVDVNMSELNFSSVRVCIYINSFNTPTPI